MEWRDEGIILALRKHGEHDAIIETLTRDHGRHAGMVRGGMGRRQRGNIQPGNEVVLNWRGRLESHLGTFTLEVKNARSALFLNYPSKLAVLNSASALLCVSLPEHEAHAVLLDGFLALLDTLQTAQENVESWGPLLVRWELGLLSELGFGLDLSCCAATGITDDLIYVSPKSGRAVCQGAGQPYHDKMLPLPAFLRGEETSLSDVRDGFHLTEFFLERHLLGPHNKKIPQARRMIYDYMS